MIESISFIFGAAVMWLEGFFFYQIISGLLKPRKNWILKIIGWIGCAGIVSIIIYPQDPWNITYALLAFLVITWVAFEGKWLIRVSAVMLFYPIIIAINFMMGQTFGSLIIYFFGEGSLQNEVLYSLSFVIPAVFWFLYGRYLKKKLSGIRDLLDGRSWILLDIICLASMTAIFCCIYYTPAESWKVIPCMTACAVTNIGSVRMASYLADNVRGEMERRNLRMQQNYYEELENSQLQIRKFRHDMKNHFAAAGQLLGEGKMQEAKDYLSELSGYMEARNRQFCKNGIVNALLNVKYNMAAEEGIDCFFHISIDGMMGLDDIDLCTIFANTLDNAIEAQRKISREVGRRLSAKARYTENGYFSYEIINPKVNEVQQKGARFLTDKEGKSSHGLGILSVREVVEKYNGTMDISYTETEFRVVILIEVL